MTVNGCGNITIPFEERFIARSREEPGYLHLLMPARGACDVSVLCHGCGERTGGGL